MEVVILSFWLILILLILQLAYLVWQTYQKTSKQRQQHKYTLTFSFARPSKGRNQQWQKLLRLVHGDVATANRLIDCERRRNPERSLDWCIDKAIWQLQRDRH